MKDQKQEMPDTILYRQAIKRFGAKFQIGMLTEEMGELLVAINKYDRGQGDENNVKWAIVDAWIMMEQMYVLFNMNRAEFEQIKQQRFEYLKELLKKKRFPKH